MAEVSHALLMSECYRNSSPRSASTPGPAAPDSPASSTGRVSTSPSVSNSVLLSPSIPPPPPPPSAAVNCFGSNYHYAQQYANHLNAHPLGLMGTFLSVGSYSPYAALAAAAAAAAAGMSGPMGPQLVAPIHPLTRLRHTVATSLPGPRTLPFSVENILKPEFGRAPGAPSASGSADSDQETTEITSTKQDGAGSSIKHESRSDSTPSPSKRFKHDYKKAPSSVDTDTDQSEHGDSSSRRCDNEKEFQHHRHHQKASSSSSSSEDGNKSRIGNNNNKDGERGSSTELPSDPTKMTDPAKWPAWIFCTRYSDRPSSGPRLRRAKKDRKPDEKRPRTAFTSEQLARLKNEFAENRYLNEKRRQELANELQLHENQIKIWFQNKRAKIKKTTGQKNPLALQLMAQGLYNHSTVPLDGEEDDDYQPQNEHVNSD